MNGCLTRLRLTSLCPARFQRGFLTNRPGFPVRSTCMELAPPSAIIRHGTLHPTSAMPIRYRPVSGMSGFFAQSAHSSFQCTIDMKWHGYGANSMPGYEVSGSLKKHRVERRTASAQEGLKV